MRGGHFAPRRDTLRFADASVRGTIHLVERHCVCAVAPAPLGFWSPGLPRPIHPANQKTSTTYEHHAPHLRPHRPRHHRHHRVLQPPAEHAILFEKASIAENGALIAYSGVKTGPSPKDKRVVAASRLEERHLVGAGEYPVR